MAYKFNVFTGNLDFWDDDESALDDRYVNVTGDTMTGALTLADQVDALKSGNYALQFKSGIAASGTSVGFIFDTDNNLLSTSGDKLLSIKTAGTEYVSIERVGLNNKVSVNTAIGNFGANTATIGYAFGNNNIVNGNGATAAGVLNTATGQGATAIGYGNTASVSGGTAIGLQNTTNNGFYNVVMGFSNTAQGAGSVVLGLSNTGGTGFTSSYIIGYDNNVIGSNACALGQVNQITGIGSLALGGWSYITASYAINIGVGWGTGTSRLTNAIEGSIMLGSYSNIPTMTITPGSGDNTIGKVGIGTKTPSERLEVLGNIFQTTDNDEFIQGTGKDVKMYYDGTDWIFNPKVVGTGRMDVLGDLVHDGYYGNFYQNEVTTTVSIAVANTWYQITGNTANLNHGMTFASDQLTISANNGGKYMVNWSCSFYDGSGTQNFEVGAAVNGTVDATSVGHNTTKGVSDTVHTSGTTILDLAAGDTVDLRIRNTGSTNNPTVNHLTFTLVWVGK